MMVSLLAFYHGTDIAIGGNQVTAFAILSILA